MRAKALIIGATVLLALTLAASTALAALFNVSRPQISGTAAVGSTLTATAGTWENVDSVTMQWWQCDPTVQDGCTNLEYATMLQDATSPTYSPSPEDVGFDLFVTERAVGGGYVVLAQSNIVGPVTAPSGTVPPRNLTLPEIQGRLVVGARLTVTTGTWDGTPKAFDYDWEGCPVSASTSGSQANCTPVGTGASYVVGAADLGRLVEAGVTARNRMGDSDEAFSKFVGPVTAAGTGPGQSQHSPQVTSSGKVSIKAVGKSFVVIPAVHVVCPRGGSSCTVDVLAQTKVRTTVRHKPTWHTIGVARVHQRLSAGRARDMSFTLTRQGASWLTSKRTLTLTVTTQATVAGAKAAKLVKRITIHRPKVVTHKP